MPFRINSNRTGTRTPPYLPRLKIFGIFTQKVINPKVLFFLKIVVRENENLWEEIQGI